MSSSSRLDKLRSSSSLRSGILFPWSNHATKKNGPLKPRTQRHRSLSNSPNYGREDDIDTEKLRVNLLLDDNKTYQKYITYLNDPVRERIMYGYTKDELEEYIDIASQQDKDVDDKHSEELAQRFRKLQSRKADREWQEMKKRAEKRFNNNTSKSSTIYSDPRNYAYGGLNKRKTYKNKHHK